MYHRQISAKCIQALANCPIGHKIYFPGRCQRYFSPEDEKLHWIAFQISIIGVMDNHENAQDGFKWRPSKVEMDDLESWVSDFKFDIGSMVKEGPDGWIKGCI